ncbi:hypothetical protein MPNT_170011 [Candidatus Methylacidithermus pantelleriae]|uniref:Uncharacterized protein n=1 Tax=Candidatus Methylacidithermus pantelleriae TaxID=2744239 RepID=A0A8J2FS88_9BACT|nr:hypothetical protein MPNT_170011 [Candidatus Methylacidithermus pantelleriae]
MGSSKCFHSNILARLELAKRICLRNGGTKGALPARDPRWVEIPASLSASGHLEEISWERNEAFPPKGAELRTPILSNRLRYSLGFQNSESAHPPNAEAIMSKRKRIP